jgi:Flp pilus assembly protein TadB
MHRLEIEKSKIIRLEHATKEQKAKTDKQRRKIEEELSKTKIHFNHQSTKEQNKHQNVRIALGENILLLQLLLLLLLLLVVVTGIALTFSFVVVVFRINQDPKRPKRSRQEHFENQIGRGRA